MVKISVSVLGAENKIDAIKKLNHTDADFLHLDLMDGKFVPFKTPGFKEISKVVINSTKKLEVHLMVENPTKYIEEYALLNTEYITIHCEVKNINHHLHAIKEYGLKAGLAVNPKTPIVTIIPYLNDVDLVIIMSVEPGLPGQTFMPEVLSKVSQLKELITENNYNITIGIDGGLTDQNSSNCIDRGVDMICSGTFITSSEDYQEHINKLRG